MSSVNHEHVGAVFRERDVFKPAVVHVDSCPHLGVVSTVSAGCVPELSDPSCVS